MMDRHLGCGMVHLGFNLFLPLRKSRLPYPAFGSRRAIIPASRCTVNIILDNQRWDRVSEVEFAEIAPGQKPVAPVVPAAPAAAVAPVVPAAPVAPAR